MNSRRLRDEVVIVGLLTKVLGGNAGQICLGDDASAEANRPPVSAWSDADALLDGVKGCLSECDRTSALAP